MKKTLLATAIALFSFLFINSVQAEDLFPPQATASAPEFELSPVDDTHPIIRLTPEKSEIVRLDREARSVIVGNPTQLSVLMDNTKTLVLVPQTLGATHFTVLDKEGKVIMQRHVVVASPKESYIRIRRACVNTLGGVCQEISMYYCPDMCHPVTLAGPAIPGAGLSALFASGGDSGGNTGGSSASPETVPGAFSLDELIKEMQNSFEDALKSANPSPASPNDDTKE